MIRGGFLDVSGRSLPPALAQLGERILEELDGLLVGFVVYLALMPLRRRVQPDAAAPVSDEVTA